MDVKLHIIRISCQNRLAYLWISVRHACLMSYMVFRIYPDSHTDTLSPEVTTRQSRNIRTINEVSSVKCNLIVSHF